MTRRPAAALATTTDTAPEPAVLRVREPGDILGVLPYMLGFHPTESLVAAFVRDRRVVVTARMDLAVAADLEALVDQLEMVSLRVDSRALLLVGYSADPEIRDVVRDLADVVPFALVDALAVSGDTWWSVCCEGACCPAEGRPYDIGTHPLAAEAVLAGISAATTREDVAALTAGPAAADRERLLAATDATARRLAGLNRRRRQRRMKQIVERVLRSGGPTETEALEIAVLARDLAVRDTAWALMTRQQGEAHVALWRAVVAVTVWPYEAAPLGMLAVAGWLSGNGTLLNCCIDRLQEVAPDYTLLEMCRDISERAIPPQLFDTMVADLRRL